MELTHQHYDWSTHLSVMHTHPITGQQEDGRRELYRHDHQDEHLDSWDELRAQLGLNRIYAEP